jgi:ribosomal protein L11 methyltransferase
MFSVSTAPEVLADLYEAGTLGIIERDGWLEAFFEDRETAARFGDPIPAAGTDWVQHTYDAWPPVLVGEKFFLVPPWRSEPAPPGRFRLEINPGQQCGTGRHPCTQMCLEAMETVVRPSDSVLDVGSGSGILSLAAKLLGAGRVIACDIDPDAARVVPFFVGSVDAVRSRSFDVVVANIHEGVIGEMRADLERIAPRRILSGFRDEDGEWICLAIDENGSRRLHRRE